MAFPPDSEGRCRCSVITEINRKSQTDRETSSYSLIPTNILFPHSYLLSSTILRNSPPKFALPAMAAAASLCWVLYCSRGAGDFQIFCATTLLITEANFECVFFIERDLIMVK